MNETINNVRIIDRIVLQIDICILCRLEKAKESKIAMSATEEKYQKQIEIG